jgi:formate dehydrogenase subunit beta
MHLENLILIGLNCTGTFSPVTAKEMFKEKFGVNPTDVIKEEIEDGKIKIRLKDETEVERDLKILEEEGYGRRENCRRCEINIPTMADIACGRWGTTNEKKTFIEVCSEKGSNLIESAIKADSIKVERPNSEAIETRRKQDALAIKLAQEWQEIDFAPFKAMSADERFSYWSSQFNQCIKCFGCRDACPICFCEHCMLEPDRGYVSGGEIPPDPLWPMVRICHVMDSCINCGQCQDACPMELPLAKLIFMLNKEIAPRFDYEPGINVEALAPSATVTDTELTIEDVALFLKKSA